MGALGLMSGTSLDGIDVAFIRSDGEHEVSRGPSRTYAYDEGQRGMLRQALEEAASMADRHARPGNLAKIELALTDWHAAAAQRFLKEAGISASDVSVAGFHGQTVIHRPEKRLTVQLGDGQLLARRLGITVAYDMRAADMAAGGQGAPLVPAYHRALAAAIDARPVAFVNIGGVGNATWIGAEDQLAAFDTGPGNALIDDWVRTMTGAARDEGGALAKTGVVQESVVAQFLGDAFFEQRGPKSLDRNSFSGVSLAGLSAADGAATLTAVTARAIARAVDGFPEAPKLWVICGGGRHNGAIMAMLKALLPDVCPAEALGFDGDAMEAEAWGYLAVRCMRGLPITFPTTTRAPKPMTGGVVARAR
jgi:anhydro-N-acetylmuramic acid kinase